MKNEFIITENVIKFGDICQELEDSMSLIGPSLAMGTSPAGRGKSETSKRRAANSRAIFLPPMNKRSPLMLLREITFDLAKVKPGRIEPCLEIIGDEMAKERRLIVIDEADLLPMSILEMLRNVNERYSCPIMLLGETELRGKVASRRRLASRIRRSMEFAPLTQPDIILFFKKALDLELSPSVTAIIHRHSQGDWRPVLTLAASIERAMKASDLKKVSERLVRGIIGENA